VSDSTTLPTFDHEVPDGAPMVAPPLEPVEPGERRSAAEEARTLVAATNAGTLATLCEDGSPWASLVAYGVLGDGSPVLFVSRLAQHGRNLLRETRASLSVAAHPAGDDVLANGRVTLAGVAERPEGGLREAALDRYLEAVPAAKAYAGFGDFTLWVLHVDRVRWVGGYGRMASATAADYAGAEPDPVGPSAAYAIAHLNEDHADALLVMAQALGGHPDATSAECQAIDRLGLDLFVTTPRGVAFARLPFAEPVTVPGGLRGATVELARRARGG
jgi:heme oxygenase (biliverdin-IX-beta and delta-forming)